MSKMTFTTEKSVSLFPVVVGIFLFYCNDWWLIKKKQYTMICFDGVEKENKVFFFKLYNPFLKSTILFFQYNSIKNDSYSNTRTQTEWKK